MHCFMDNLKKKALRGNKNACHPMQRVTCQTTSLTIAYDEKLTMLETIFTHALTGMRKAIEKVKDSNHQSQHIII